MLVRSLWTALFTVSVLNLAGAQDAFKVEPTHYKLDFENDTVQVVNVHYGPHEKSSLHSHPGGVVVTLTPGHLKFTDEHGKVRETHSLAGEARWFPPFKHSVENLGSTPYNAIYIGIKADHKASLTAPGQNRGLEGEGLPVTDAKTQALVARALAAMVAEPK